MSILRTLLTGLFILSSAVAFAADYTFTGNGDWSDTANWQGGLVPPQYFLPSGSTITITGNASIGDANCIPLANCENPGHFGRNDGTITIAAGGSLTLNNSTTFSNGGTLIVGGTLINNTILQGYSTGTITVNGTLLNKFRLGNAGLLTVNNGGVVNNVVNAAFSCAGPPFMEMVWEVPGRLIIRAGGTFNNEEGVRLFEPGNLTNNGILNDRTR